MYSLSQAWPGARSSVTLVVHESAYQSVKGLRKLATQHDAWISIRTVTSVAQAITVCKTLQADVAFVGRSALEAASPEESNLLFRSTHPVRVIVHLDGEAEQESLQTLIRMGCFGFVNSEMSTAVLKRAIEKVLCGEMWVDRRTMTAVLQMLLSAENGDKLSPREVEILGLIGRRLNNKEIAERLFISRETVRWHLRNIHTKTNMHNRDKLIEFARAIGGE